jgi:hypothetical protein
MTTLPVLEQLPDQLQQRGSNPELLRDELLAVIRRAMAEHPRSLQVKIGPSEVDHPCARRIGYKLLGYDENPGEPPIPLVIVSSRWTSPNCHGRCGCRLG